MFEIAKNTLKEFLRIKVIYVGLIIWIILIFSSYLLDTLTINQWNKAIIDFSLTVIEVFALILVLFLWAYMLFNEFNKKTILLILSKIKHKSSFILWKFIGFSIILALVYILLTVWFLLALMLHHINFEFYYLQAIFLSYVKMLVVLAFILFFSTFVNPFLALIASSFIYIISHASAFMLYFTMADKEKSISPIMQFFIKIIYYVFPNFQDLSMKEYFLSPYLSNYSNFHFLLSTFAGAFVYIVVLLIFSSIIFSKKEF